MTRISGRFPTKVRASRSLAPCERRTLDTASWTWRDVPWPSSRIGTARILLPVAYHIPVSPFESENPEPASINRALGVWYALEESGAPSRPLRSFALWLETQGVYPEHAISPVPTLLSEQECMLVGEDGRRWNVASYVLESSDRPLAFDMSAYSECGSGLFLQAASRGGLLQGHGEAMTILASVKVGAAA